MKRPILGEIVSTNAYDYKVVELHADGEHFRVAFQRQDNGRYLEMLTWFSLKDFTLKVRAPSPMDDPREYLSVITGEAT